MSTKLLIKSVLRARGVAAKFSVTQIDRGLDRIRTQLKNIQTDKSYVKAGLMGKANRPRPQPKLFEQPGHAEFAKAQAAINPVLLAILASHSAKAQAKRKTQPPPLTSVQLGIIHEFGMGNVPARPFIRPAFEKSKPLYLELLKRMVRDAVYAGKMPYTRALGIIGARMSADIKKFVTTGPQIPPPNAPAYFAEKVRRGDWKEAERRRNAAIKGKEIKEGPRPPPRTLVDTGRMIGSVTFGVVARSSGDKNK